MKLNHFLMDKTCETGEIQRCWFADFKQNSCFLPKYWCFLFRLKFAQNNCVTSLGVFSLALARQTRGHFGAQIDPQLLLRSFHRVIFRPEPDVCV